MRTKTMMPIGVAIAALLLVSGCSTSTDGEPAPLNGAAATVEPAAPGDMDPGPYSTVPLPDFGTVTSQNQGRIVEGQRMAEFVVLPTEIDPKLTEYKMPTLVLKSGSAMSMLVSKEVAEIATAEKMYTGFAATRAYEDKAANRSIVHAVLRFPDAAAATRAADAMSTQDTLPTEYGPGAVSTPIDILPQSRVTTKTTEDEFTAQSYTPHGDYVIYTWASSPLADKDWTAQTVAKALDLQGPMIDKFPSTPLDQLEKLPMDIDNVLIYAVQDPTGEGKSTNDDAVYGPRGAAMFASDPAKSLENFKDTNTSFLAHSVTNSNLYKAGSTEDAQSLFDRFNEDAKNDGYASSATPPGVPNTVCFTKDTAAGVENWCHVHRGAFVATIGHMDDEKVVFQMTTAQYQLLESAK